MADQFLGGNLGKQMPSDITYGTSTGSTDVELRVKSASGLTRMETLKVVEAIHNYIKTTTTWVA
jgi:hypothetical protein